MDIKKGLLALLFATATCSAEESLVERLSRIHNTPRKVENFMKQLYSNINDASPNKLNSSEEFLESGLGDEKELVNASADLLKKICEVTKIYYSLKDKTELYVAYIRDPQQKNNYILHLEKGATETKIETYYGIGGREITIVTLQRSCYNQPKLRTGFKSLEKVKTFIEKSNHKKVVEWGTFEYDPSEANGLKKMKK